MSAPSLGAPEGAPGHTGAARASVMLAAGKTAIWTGMGSVPLAEAWSKVTGKATAIALRETLAKLSAEQGVNREPKQRRVSP